MKAKDKECAILNRIVNETKKLAIVATEAESIGFKILEHVGDTSLPGFVGVAFEKVGENEIVIAVRGTAPRWCKFWKGISGLAHCPKVFTTDFKDDYRIFKEQLPEQLHQGETLLASIRSKYSEHTVVLTGFSLGGANTQILGIKHGLRTVSFDSPGMKALVEQYAGGEALAKNKEMIKIYNAGPNLINTFGEYYTDVTQVKFSTQFKGNGFLGYAQYTLDQHEIELMAKHFDNQVFYPQWIQSQFAGYTLYVLTAEQEGKVVSHRDKLWAKKSAKLVSEGREESDLVEEKAKFEKDYHVAISNNARSESEYEASFARTLEDLASLIDDGLDFESYVRTKITEEESRFLEMLEESEEDIDLGEVEPSNGHEAAEGTGFDIPSSAASVLSALEALAMNGPDDGATERVEVEMQKDSVQWIRIEMI